MVLINSLCMDKIIDIERLAEDDSSQNLEFNIDKDEDFTCKFVGYNCSQERIKDYKYCEWHILEDKNLPFKQCSYTYPKSNRSCTKGVPITNPPTMFCKEHSMTDRLEKQKAQTLQNLPPENLATWISQLSYHEVAPNAEFQNVIPDMSSIPSIAKTAFERVSSENATDDLQLDDVDVNSLPRLEDKCEFEESDIDPLENAGVYTVEEVSKIYLDKLQKLRALYAGQYQSLFHNLKQNRRQYLQALKVEKESLVPIHSQPKETSEERSAYEELKALSRFHKQRGVESLLAKQNLDRRMQLSEGIHKPSSFAKCIYSEGSWRCGERTVPYAKHCFKHILQDSNQVLFKLCGATQCGEDECVTPVIPLPHTSSCVYHTKVPQLLPITKSAEDKSLQNQPDVLDFSDSSSFIVSEMPPENVMEEDVPVDVVNSPVDK